MTDLPEALLDLIRPQLAAMVEAEVGRRLAQLEQKPWLSTKEAAEYLSITPDAVRQRVQAQTLPAYYDSGGKLRFRREDLDQSMTPR